MTACRTRFSVKHHNKTYPVFVESLHRYAADHSIALQLMTDSEGYVEPFSKPTVCLWEEEGRSSRALEEHGVDNVIILRTWNEHQGIAVVLAENCIIEPEPLAVCPVGLSKAWVCRLTESFKQTAIYQDFLAEYPITPSIVF